MDFPKNEEDLLITQNLTNIRISERVRFVKDVSKFLKFLCQFKELNLPEQKIDDILRIWNSNSSAEVTKEHIEDVRSSLVAIVFLDSLKKKRQLFLNSFRVSLEVVTSGYAFLGHFAVEWHDFMDRYHVPCSELQAFCKVLKDAYAPNGTFKISASHADLLNSTVDSVTKLSYWDLCEKLLCILTTGRLLSPEEDKQRLKNVKIKKLQAIATEKASIEKKAQQKRERIEAERIYDTQKKLEKREAAKAREKRSKLKTFKKVLKEDNSYINAMSLLLDNASESSLKDIDGETADKLIDIHQQYLVLFL